MNTHETYVSLETAKLLKQAGFDWDCKGIFVLDSKNDTEQVFSTATFMKHGAEVEGYIKLPAPTLSVAQKWLREVKRAFVSVSVYCVAEQEFVDSDKFSVYIDRYDISDSKWATLVEKDDFNSYEEALETGIKIYLEKFDAAIKNYLEKKIIKNMSNNEVYVSFELAKLLKEAGYPQCKEKEHYSGLKYTLDGQLTAAPFAEHYAAPTLAIADKWVREKLNTHIEVMFSNTGHNYFVRYCDVTVHGMGDGHWYRIGSNDGYKTYEEALEDGMKEYLTMLNKWYGKRDVKEPLKVSE